MENIQNNKPKDKHPNQKGISVLFPKGLKDPYYSLIKDVSGISPTIFMRTALTEYLTMFENEHPTIDYLFDGQYLIEIVPNSHSSQHLALYATKLLEQDEHYSKKLKDFLTKCDGSMTLDEIKKKYRYYSISQQKKEKYDISKVWIPIPVKYSLDRFCKENHISISNVAIAAAKYKLKKDYGIEHDSQKYPF